LPEIAPLLEVTPQVDTNAPFNLSEPIQRPQNRPRIIIPEEKSEGVSDSEERESRRKKIDSTNLALVVFKRKEFWRDPLRVFYSNRDDARKYVIASIQQALLNNPESYNENFILLKTIEANIDSILPNLPSGKYDRLDILTAQDALQKLQEYGVVGTQALEVKVDKEEQRVETQKISYSEARKIAQEIHNNLSPAEKTSTGVNEVQRQITNTLDSARKDLSSSFLRNFSGFLQNNILAKLKIPGLGGFGSGSLGPSSIGYTGFGSGIGSSTGGLLQKGFGSLSNLLKLGGKNLGPLAARLGAALVGMASAEILVPLGIILAVVIGVVAFFTLMQGDIQHGMFLAQKTSGGVGNESQFIILNKVANPPSYGGELPTEIQFSIVIGAKEKNLNNVKVTDSFSVYGKNSPPTPTLPSGVSFPTSVAAGSSQTITFKINVGPEYKDSVITNTVTIKADVEGGPNGETASRSVPVVIGTPNTGCFTLEGSWPEDLRAQVLAASAILSQFPAYMAGICQDSEWGPGVTIKYAGDTADYGGFVNGQKVITLFYRAFDTSGGRGGCAFYTIAHETGHVYANKNPGIYNNFRIEVNPTEADYLISYPARLGRKPSEDFAESIAMYIKRTIGDSRCSGAYDVGHMESVSPKHYNFMQKYVK
jgi:hypothetical protein